MKIVELNIDGFGHFHDTQVGPFASPVVILYGPNEAGKTTLLEYIRTVLFGFPPRNRDSHYPPLAGGRHGGRITVSNAADDRYVIERHVGVRGGSVSVRDGSGQVHDESMLARLLGNVSTDVFKNVFAFSLDELQTGDLLGNASVNGQIYSAGLGATRLPDAFKVLSSRREEIYRQRGSNQIMAQLITNLGTVDSQLSLIKGNAAEYAKKVADLRDIDDELTRIKSKSDVTTVRRRELARHSEGWDDWVEVVNAEARLAEIPQFERFPENAIARLEAIEALIRSSKQELEDAAAQCKRSVAAANVSVENEEILDSYETVTRINRGRNAFDMSIADLPERKAELAAQEESLAKRLRDLGPGWDQERLESFDTSIEVRDQIDHWKEKLSERRQARHREQNQLQQYEEALGAHKEAETDARATLERCEESALSQQQIDERRRALRASRTRLGEYERRKESRSQLKYQLESLKNQHLKGGSHQTAGSLVVPALLILMAAVILAVGVILGQQALVVAAASAVALIVVAVFLFSKRGASLPATFDLTLPLGNQVDVALAEEERARQILNEAASVFNIDPIDADQLDSLEVQLDSMGNVLRTWNSSSEALATVARDLLRQEQRVASAVEAVKNATLELTMAEAQWQQWLFDRGLVKTLMPETMSAYLGQVESCFLILEQVKDKRHRVEAIEVDILQYRDLVRPLAKCYSISIQSTDLAHLAMVADTLVERFEAARDGVTLRKQNRELAEEAKQYLTRREHQFQEAAEELAKLLKLGVAQDSEEFRAKAYSHDLRAKLEQETQDSLTRLQRISGPGTLLDQFRGELSQTNRQQIVIEEAELSASVKELEDRQSEHLEQRGRVETLIQQLAKEEKSSELRVERASLLERLREQARKWAELRIAEEMLARARDKYQKERQPGVLQHAQSFFGAVTGGRYNRLYAPIGEQTITVEDENNSEKRPSDLSRGTREQLYLALRFGLIREFGEHVESLPVIVDEILVNFDPERALRAAEAFSELSRTNQILVFTCHPSMVEAFQGTCADSQVIEIDSIQ